MCPASLGSCRCVSQQLLRGGDDNKIFVFKPRYLRCCWGFCGEGREGLGEVDASVPVLRQGVNTVGVHF